VRYKDLQKLTRHRDPLVRRYAARVLADPRNLDARRGLAYVLRYAAPLPDWASDVPSQSQSSLGDRMAARLKPQAAPQQPAPPRPIRAAPPQPAKPQGVPGAFGPALSDIARKAGPAAAGRIDETHRVLHRELGIPMEWRTFHPALDVARELSARHGTKLPAEHERLLSRPGYSSGGYIDLDTGHTPQKLAIKAGTPGVKHGTEVTAPMMKRQLPGEYVMDTLGGIRVGGFADTPDGRFPRDGIAYIPPDEAPKFEPKLAARLGLSRQERAARGVKGV
jgi:hypothetical protein